jgi:hypothetical protein
MPVDQNLKKKQETYRKELSVRAFINIHIPDFVGHILNIL